jgi:plasmid stabilization system protein ParE
VAQIVWLPEALDDFERLYDFLHSLNIEAAMKAALLIIEGVEILESTPHIGKPLENEADIRELYLAFGAGHYVLRYKTTTDTAVIIRVWHSKETR